MLERLALECGAIQGRSADLDRHGAFPDADLDRLRAIGVLAVLGSGSLAPLDLMQALRLLGRANLSLGRIVEGHVNGSRLVSWYGDGRQSRDLAADLEGGALYGVWSTEPEPGVRLIDGPDGLTLEGRKSYATGAGHVDRAIVTALDPAGGRQMVIIDGRDLRRADGEAWRVRGMRATCSGDYDLTGLRITRGDLVGAPGDYGKEPRFTAGAWRFAAVQLGGLERIVQLLRGHMASSRTAPDPVQTDRFGQTVAHARSALMWVKEAAVRSEAPGAGPNEAACVLLTRSVVERAALAVITAATRTVGTRAFFEDHPLDQACRDLALYLRQGGADQAQGRAGAAFLDHDCWTGDPLW
jgi:alkylation response protein AidB-like acyl-CoA dehydrogenase